MIQKFIVCENCGKTVPKNVRRPSGICRRKRFCSIGCNKAGLVYSKIPRRYYLSAIQFLYRQGYQSIGEVPRDLVIATASYQQTKERVNKSEFSNNS